MLNKTSFRILHVDLHQSKTKAMDFSSPAACLGGSGLAAALFEEFGVKDAPAFDPRQPLIFAIGPLTGCFPLMSKVVCGFKSPYSEEYAESHAGGRLGLSMRFSGYDGLVITGEAKNMSVLEVGSREMAIHDVHYLSGVEALIAGKHFRRFGKGHSGHRSMMRIGPAGENKVAYACINVDTYRHFGRLGSGAVMGAKNLKAIVVLGDGSYTLPEGKAYSKLFKEIHKDLTHTDMMRKYHDLGTPINMKVLNELNALPWCNMQKTSNPEAIDDVSGEKFAEQLLLRQTACSGCPVGCIHIGLLRHMFAHDHDFLYRQVSYDHETVFAQGAMLGMTQAMKILALLDETEKMGLDAISAGVALAWATEAFEKGLITEEHTVLPLEFDNVDNYRTAIKYIARGKNEFYQTLGMGALVAAKEYGGEDFACVLGQEMAGYGTGEAFFVSQAMGFRYSHLDSGGYSYDQKHDKLNVQDTVDFFVQDERMRVMLTCLVSCLFARGAYTVERVQQAMDSLGMGELAGDLENIVEKVTNHRWKLKIETGYDPNAVTIPKRFSEITTWKGPVDRQLMDDLQAAYAKEILAMAGKA